MKDARRPEDTYQEKTTTAIGEYNTRGQQRQQHQIEKGTFDQLSDIVTQATLSRNFGKIQFFNSCI